MRFFFQFATRGRPRQFNQAMLAYTAALTNHHQYHFNIVMDEDDESMQTDTQREAMDAMSKKVSMSFWYAPSGKILATNSFIKPDFDFLVNITDDSRPGCMGFDALIVREFNGDHPKLLHCYDGYQMENCSNPIMNFAMYRELGYIYNPAYESNFAKDDLVKTCKRLKTWTYWHTTLIQHEGVRLTGKDATFKRNNSEHVFMKDQETYRKRSAAGFPNIPL